MHSPENLERKAQLATDSALVSVKIGDQVEFSRLLQPDVIAATDYWPVSYVQQPVSPEQHAWVIQTLRVLIARRDAKKNPWPFSAQLQEKAIGDVFWKLIDSLGYPSFLTKAQHQQIWRACIARRNYVHQDLIIVLTPIYRQLLPKLPKEAISQIVVAVALQVIYEEWQGVLLETTESLDELLLASDTDTVLPISFFSAPYSMQYVHFNPSVRKRLRDETQANGYMPVGVYCHHAIDAKGIHRLCLTWMMESEESSEYACAGIEGRVDDPDQPLAEWLVRLVSGLEKDMQCITRWTLHLAKIFMYLGLKDARIQTITPQADLRARTERVGAKKRKKFERQVARVYDRIVVGPESLPQELMMNGASDSVSPHWRRGHFRMQTHGPRNSLRKLMFIAPTIVAADRLHETTIPGPKKYQISAG